MPKAALNWKSGEYILPTVKIYNCDIQTISFVLRQIVKAHFKIAIATSMKELRKI